MIRPARYTRLGIAAFALLLLLYFHTSVTAPPISSSHPLDSVTDSEYHAEIEDHRPDPAPVSHQTPGEPGIEQPAAGQHEDTAVQSDLSEFSPLNDGAGSVENHIQSVAENIAETAESESEATVPPPPQPQELEEPPVIAPELPEDAQTIDLTDTKEHIVYSRTVVVGRLHFEDTDWIAEELPDWQNAIYYVDLLNNETSPSGLRTIVNKAREAMPYLTYIIDNYPNFPDVVAFIHPHKDGMPQAWHNDAPSHSAVYMLQDLLLGTVVERGYVNLRCNNEVGCPAEIVPFRDPPIPRLHAEHAFAEVYSHFFYANESQMREQIPVVATQCCAQFAVSGDQLRKRPKEDYERYRAFLLETEHDDDTIGRVMEYMWHIIFGRDAVHCEDVFECWCALYGRCHDFP